LMLAQIPNFAGPRPANPRAEVIATGSELLSGKTVDTNSAYIARALQGIGIGLCSVTLAGDDELLIAAAMDRALARSDVVIVTGGLGPTVDDKTRMAAGWAVGSPLEFQPALLAQIEARFARMGRPMSENNRQQAFIPAGALAIENPVGTAPCFAAERGRSVLIALPGVPRELFYLLEHAVLPWLAARFPAMGAIHARVLHVAGLGESVVDAKVADLERLANPVVGLTTHAGVVDLHITARAATAAAAAVLVADVERTARARLGAAVFGADGTTLATVALAHIAAAGHAAACVEQGTSGELARRLAAAGTSAFRGGALLPAAAGADTNALLDEALAHCARMFAAPLVLACVLHASADVLQLGIALQPPAPAGQQRFVRTMAAPSTHAAEWGANLALNLLRGQSA
ncbi:MAG: hypothetical protein RL635_1572, partial [Chloroflexota bacterium]